MKASEIRAMSTDEITNKIDETHKALFNLHFRAAAGQVTDFNTLTAMRRDMARMKSILRERELAARAGAGLTQGGRK
ncbi:MAG TPA: 50S ribosomal protein L29 [Anaerolineae bacterium]